MNRRIRKRWENNEGLTLIETVASLALMSVILLVVFSVLYGGIQAYGRSMEEAKLRDEADYIMANFIEGIFTLKASEVEKTALPESGKNNYYFQKKNGEKTGFIDGKAVVNGRALPPLNDGVRLDEDSRIESLGDGKFRITLSLKSKKFEEHLELTSILSLIDDTKGGEK